MESIVRNSVTEVPDVQLVVVDVDCDVGVDVVDIDEVDS